MWQSLIKIKKKNITVKKILKIRQTFFLPTIMFFGTCACKYATYSRMVGHIVLYGNELHRLLIGLIKKNEKIIINHKIN